MSAFNFLFFIRQKNVITTSISITKLYILTNIILITFYLLEESYNQLVKDIPSEVLYNILDYILDNTIELEPHLTAFRYYIVELLELRRVSKEDI